MKENGFVLSKFYLQLHINTTEHMQPRSTSLLKLLLLLQDKEHDYVFTTSR